MNKSDANPKLDALPKLETCRAVELGVTDFAHCLLSNPFCIYSLSFGEAYLCKHPRRAEIIANTKRLPASEGTASREPGSDLQGLGTPQV